MYDYKLLKDTSDDIESTITNFDNNNNNLIELIEITKEENKENEKNVKNKENNLCSICLLENNKNSTKLDICNCNQKYHPKCIDELKKKYSKCPICKTKFTIEDDKLLFIDRLLLLLVVIITPFLFWYIISITFGLGKLIFYPSTLKYCDNKYVMCNYFKVSGTLVSNKVEEKYSNFNVKYLLKSSYNWTNTELNNDKYKGKTGTCMDLETHIYDSYDNAMIIKEKSIGTTKSIFVSFSNPLDCKLNYKWLDSNKLYFFLSCIFSLITIPFCCILPIYENFYSLSQQPINLSKYVLIITHLISMIFFIISIFMVDYYVLYFFHK